VSERPPTSDDHAAGADSETHAKVDRETGPSLAQRFADRTFAASEGLHGPLLAQFEAIPYFRQATDPEVEFSFAAYQRGDIETLIQAWATHAEPTRASMPPALRWAYTQAGRAPRTTNALVFLTSLRAVLRAGERFRSGLQPELRAVLETEFPWLEHRHEHVPAGYTPSFEFPPVFREFLERGDLDQARARWQLAVGLNEVQQCAYSDYAARLFRLPELRRHAQRERDLARNYFGHWSPHCTEDLWRETLYVLDALNAAVFELLCDLRPGQIFGRGLIGALTQRAQWRAFVEGLDGPQITVPAPKSQAR